MLYTQGALAVYTSMLKQPWAMQSRLTQVLVFGMDSGHVVGTYDGVNPRLYVDGALITGTPGTGDEILYSITGNLLIGKYFRSPDSSVL